MGPRALITGHHVNLKGLSPLLNPRLTSGSEWMGLWEQHEEPAFKGFILINMEMKHVLIYYHDTAGVHSDLIIKVINESMFIFEIL